MFVHRKKRDRNSWEPNAFILTVTFIYCRSESVPLLSFCPWRWCYDLEVSTWSWEHVVLPFSPLFLQWQTLPQSQGWCSKEGWLRRVMVNRNWRWLASLSCLPRAFSPGPRQLLELHFLVSSAGSYLQRRHHSHLITKHTAFYCLVLLSRRSPGLFTAGACDEGGNIN